MDTIPSKADPAANGGPTDAGDWRPDAALFFAAPAHARLLDLIRHLAENTEQVALVSGWLGAGKTTLLYRILGEAPRHWLPCRVDANPMMHPDQLLNCLARCVELAPNDPGLTEQLSEAFAALRQQGLLPVVVVDDADQLPPSSLMTLLRLFEQRTDGVPPFALILLAEPLIETTLDAPQLHAMGTERFNRLAMPLLEPAQIGDYIRHFLQVEGVEGRLELTAEQLQRIGKESEGLPGKINEMVLRVLREPGEQRERAQVPDWRQWLQTVPISSWVRQLPRQLPKVPPAARLPVAAVVVILVLGLSFQDQINRLFQGTPEAAPSDRVEPERSPGSVVGDRWVEPLSLPPQPDAATEPEPEPADLPVSEPLIPPRNQQPPVEMEPRPEPAAAANAEPPPVSAAAERPVVPALKKVAPQPPPGAAPPPQRKSAPPAPVADRGMKNADWLLKQRPDTYTLQLLGVSDEQALLRFVHSHGLSREVHYIETRRNGRPWFVLLYGIYRDRDAAVQALDKLPPVLRKGGAWPRPLAGIQDAIRARGR